MGFHQTPSYACRQHTLGFFVSKDLQLRKGVSAEMGQGASQVVLAVKNPSANARDADLTHPWIGKITWRRKMAIHTSILA